MQSTYEYARTWETITNKEGVRQVSANQGVTKPTLERVPSLQCSHDILLLEPRSVLRRTHIARTSHYCLWLDSWQTNGIGTQLCSSGCWGFGTWCWGSGTSSELRNLLLGSTKTELFCTVLLAGFRTNIPGFGSRTPNCTFISGNSVKFAKLW